MESLSLVDVPISLVEDLPDRRSTAKRIYDEDLDKDLKRTRRKKMRDLNSVLGYEGLRKCSTPIEADLHQHHDKMGDYFQNSLLSHEPNQLKLHNSPEADDVSLSLGLVENSVQTHPVSLSIIEAKQSEETRKPIFIIDDENEGDSNITCSVDDFECGSSTGPVENEPLKTLKEMKQNGYLSSSHSVSSSHGGIPIPKQRGRQGKRKKDEEVKKRSELATKEQHNCIKLAAPSGLLSGLNPGIIKHVRNSKQVISIIAAMLGSTREVQKTSVDHHVNANSALSSAFPGIDLITPKPPSRNASSAMFDDFLASHDNVSSLSIKGANVATQWLDLLQNDIIGRLAALRRSKIRVRNIIQTELPYLLSREMSSNREGGDHSKMEMLNMHMAQWRSIFTKMEKSLCEEGRRLEAWLKQVQDKLFHCERGLKYFGDNGFPRASQLEGLSGLKKMEIVEREHAIGAAAASVYSTCNFVMAKENVSCF